MTGRQVWMHPDVSEALTRWPHLEQKVDWSLVQLAVSGGKSLNVKGFTAGQAAWRRTPVQGNDFYLWWIPGGVSGTQGREWKEDIPTVFVRGVTHHDSEPPSFAPRSDYSQVVVSELQPLHPDQLEVQSAPSGDVDIQLIAGSPGSGKTVALTYAGIEWANQGPEREAPGQASVLYVTYTDGLAGQAREYFEGYSVGDRIKVLTFSRLVSDLLPLRDERAQFNRQRAPAMPFAAWVDTLGSADVGPWRGYPELLRQEIRAYLVGMGLPFEWKREGIGTVPSSQILDLESYKRMRRQSLRGMDPGIDDDTLATAHHLAELALDRGYFKRQQAAHSAVEALDEAPDRPEWLTGLDAVVVDEIQDLTLVEIGVLVEVARVASRLREGSTPFRLAAAGDESQTVQPSGFDRGRTHDLLRFRLGCYPENRDFRSQRRCPGRLARLVRNSWKLYGYLPKEIKPQGEPMVGEEDPNEEGLLVRWRIATGVPWGELLDELKEHPGAALVDIDGSAADAVSRLSGDQRGLAGSQIFTPRRIKGLERKIILISGVDRALERVTDLADKHRSEYDVLAALVARDKIDDVRVAVSRSTHMMVVMAREASRLASDLQIDDAQVLDWDGLCRVLREEDKDLSAFDRAHEHHRNADELLRQDDYKEAQQQNELALRFARDSGDAELIAMARRQRDRIDEGLAEKDLRQALIEANEHLEDGDFAAAYERWRHTSELRSRITAPDPIRAAAEFWRGRSEQLDRAAGAYWMRARDARREKRWSEAVTGYRRMAEIRQTQGRQADASALVCLADRYEGVPPRVKGEEEVAELIDLIDRYIRCLEDTKRTGVDTEQEVKEDSPYWFAKKWVDEVNESLDKNYALYLPWARAASTVCEWAGTELSDEYQGFADRVHWAADDLRKRGESLQAAELLQLARVELSMDLTWLISLLKLVEAPEYEQLRDQWREAERHRLSKALGAAGKLLQADDAPIARPRAIGSATVSNETNANEEHTQTESDERGKKPKGQGAAERGTDTHLSAATLQEYLEELEDDSEAGGEGDA